MDASRERDTLFNELRGIRATLAEAYSMADHLHEKFIGSSPRQPGSDPVKQPSESISTLISDICRLSGSLREALSAHHNFIGDMSGNVVSPQGGMVPLRH